MKLGDRVIEANFLQRPNRFTVLAKLHGRRIRCYFPNPGRLRELLKPGSKLALTHTLLSRRRTSFDVIAIHNGGIWVSVDSRIPNKLVYEALRDKKLKEFASYSSIVRESTFNTSRIDFRLYNEARSCLLEVKSCTLVKNGVALFPDAPTARGTRHLMDLMKAKKMNINAAIIFVVQRSDAKAFSPNSETDPDFANALNLAAKSGVGIYAKKCRIQNFDISLQGDVPVHL